jgi:hypothetical protein
MQKFNTHYIHHPVEGASVAQASVTHYNICRCLAYLTLTYWVYEVDKAACRLTTMRVDQRRDGSVEGGQSTV